jgi:hypothetical protein
MNAVGWAAGLFAAVAVAHGQPQKASGPGTGFRLEVRVYRSDSTSNGMMMEAARVADSVFQQSGVGVEWVDCPGRADRGRPIDERCTYPTGPLQLALRMVARRNAAEHHHLGAALATRERDAAQYATVYLDSIETLVADGPGSARTLLGYIVAHELGHLLLGPDSHSTLGIMRPRWPGVGLFSTPPAEFLFNPEQANQLREAVRARAEASRESTLDRVPFGLALDQIETLTAVPARPIRK